MLDYIWSVDDNQRGPAGGDHQSRNILADQQLASLPAARHHQDHGRQHGEKKKPAGSRLYAVDRDSEIAGRNERPKPESRVKSAISILGATSYHPEETGLPGLREVSVRPVASGFRG